MVQSSPEPTTGASHATSTAGGTVAPDALFTTSEAPQGIGRAGAPYTRGVMGMQVRKLAPLRSLTLLIVGLALSGCEPLGLKAHVTTIKTGADGNLVLETREVRNAEELDRALKAASEDTAASLDESAKALSATSMALLASLTEAPPPGKVVLGDLNPKLEPWQGKGQYDFLLTATQAQDRTYDFSYVQVGVASYDDFFREVAETYAYAFQYQHTRTRARVIAGLLLGERLDDDVELDLVLSRTSAMPRTDRNRDALEHLEQLRQIHEVLAADAVAILERARSLIETGKQLVTAAPSSITNPKTALHLDLIVRGLEQSVALLYASAQLLGGHARVTPPARSG